MAILVWQDYLCHYKIRKWQILNPRLSVNCYFNKLNPLPAIILQFKVIAFNSFFFHVAKLPVHHLLVVLLLMSSVKYIHYNIIYNVEFLLLEI
jgi:hypothetical protein